MNYNDYNPLIDVDGYKPSHHHLFPDGTEAYFGYFEARKAESVFFGLQAYLKRYLSRPITQEHIDEADEYYEEYYLPYDLPIFNRKGWEYVLDKYNGHYPVTIRAVPEGSVIPRSNVLFTVECTDPECYWVAPYLETQLVRMWYPSTVATYSRNCKKVLLRYALVSSDDPYRYISLNPHDFGGRGCECYESSEIGGAAHLVNGIGSDTCAGARYANKYYKIKMSAKSIAASEHGTVTPYGKDHEVDAFRNMIHKFGRKGQVFACVSDSYNIEEACKVWATTLKQEVIDSGAFVVVRPDSGELPSTVTKCVKILESGYGNTINSKGYKVINNVGVIQGDGVNIHTLDTVCADVVIANKFSVDCVNFGMGGALLQDHTRDDLGYAMKCSATMRDGKWIDAFKSPVGDPGKASKAGRISLYRFRNGHGTAMSYTTMRIEEAEELNKQTAYSVEDALHVVYQNGKLFNETTFDEVRQRASL